MTLHSVARIACLVLATAAASTSLAMRGAPLPSIVYQINREAVVKTTTAEVTVVINSVVDSSHYDKARQDMLTRLQQLLSGDWRVTQFDRQQDQSGLERVIARASLRTEESRLSGIRDKAKNVSRPGQQYDVERIDFTPSVAEVEAARTQLRLAMIQEVNTQLVEINKQFSGQPYRLQRLSFVGEWPMTPQPQAAMARQNKLFMAVSTAPMPVSQTIQLSAMVDFSILPQKTP